MTHDSLLLATHQRLSHGQIMEGSADLQTGFNLLLCYYALGDKARMRQGFTRLLSVRQPNTLTP